MADEGEVVDGEVRVVELDDEQVADPGVSVPKEPPPGQILDVPPTPDGELQVLEPEPTPPPPVDGSSNTIPVDEPAPPVGDGSVRAPVEPVDDGAGNTILLPEEAAPPVEPAAHLPHDAAPTVNDLPADLFDAPPAFATGAVAAGAATAAPLAAGSAEAPAALEPDSAAAGTPVVDVPAVPGEPLEVVAAEADEDDPSFLERVADAVGDLWDDATDAVT